MAHGEIRGRKGKALIAVITVVDEEFYAVRDTGQFTTMLNDSNHLYRNEVSSGRYDVILARCSDRSNGPCGELVRDLAEDYRPEFIVLSGIAGGVEGRDGVALGDVVIANHVEYYEMRKMVGKVDKARRVPIDHPSLYLQDSIAERVRLLNQWQARVAVDRPGQGGDPKIIVGNIIAGEKLLGARGNQYQRKVLREFDKALAVDMESYGLGRGVYRARSHMYYNLNYLIVRGISDLVDEKDNDGMRKSWRPYAAATAAAVTMDVVDQVVAACH